MVGGWRPCRVKTAGVFAIDVRSLVREIEDFPTKGISFKDITTVLKRGDALRYVVQEMAAPFRSARPEVIAGVESRGFIFGAPIAYELGAGFVLIRKPGKLPGPTLSAQYELEYGHDTLEIHQDAVQPGQRVLMVDDLLATGGTMRAAADLVERLGGRIVGFTFMLELAFLGGRRKLQGYEVASLVEYEA